MHILRIRNDKSLYVLKMKPLQNLKRSEKFRKNKDIGNLYYIYIYM